MVCVFARNSSTTEDTEVAQRRARSRLLVQSLASLPLHKNQPERLTLQYHHFSLTLIPYWHYRPNVLRNPDPLSLLSMASFRPLEIEHAVERGLDFIYRLACQANVFSDYGSDLLWCFYLISSTSKTRQLRTRALEMGKERARQWRQDHKSLPPGCDAETVVDFLYGSSAAKKLGYVDAQLDAEIMQASGAFQAAQYFCFDPTKEPPPVEVSEQCDCGLVNERGRRRCVKCRKKLTTLNRYESGFYALTRTYSGERFGVTLGARYADVIRWLPQLRPYAGIGDPEFYDTVYFVTHVIYTLNAYSHYRLSTRWLPQEFNFLKTHLAGAISTDDPEMVGEFVDSLKAFGLDNTDRSIRRAINYLLSKQNEDGSWGDVNSKDPYARYHFTWTAVDGLRDYAWHGKRISFPKLLPAIKRAARRNSQS